MLGTLQPMSSFLVDQLDIQKLPVTHIVIQEEKKAQGWSLPSMGHWERTVPTATSEASTSTKKEEKGLGGLELR